MVLVLVLVLTAQLSSSWAARIILKNGMILEGAAGRIGTLISNPTQGQSVPAGGEQIVLVDDDLRRMYVALSQVQEVQENVEARPVEFRLSHQPVAGGGNQLAGLGRLEVRENWDRHGRRTVRVRLADGQADIIQGITKITPSYYRVQTLSGGRRLLLDQRFATSSLPTRLLRQILSAAIDEQNANDRLRVYQLFLQAERYADAEAELEGIIRDFPQLDLARERQTVRNLKASRGLREIQSRRAAGQHQLAQRALEQFPTDDIAGATLIEVREILEKYRGVEKRIETLRSHLLAQQKLVAQPDAREFLEPIIQEIHDQVNSHTLQRLTGFWQLADDPGTSANDKLALAVSGWLVGTDEATDKLPVALSLVEVRRLVRAYLETELKPRRADLLAEIRSQEAGVPRLVAALLAHMKPPWALPPPYEGVPGLYRLTVPGPPGLADTSYLVQVPPEYDPYRRYPAIVTLHGSGTTAPLQIDWWAGSLDGQGQRQGQGARHGYLVIAPEWTTAGQKKYAYSSREHAAVLNSLRDACRRFAIDTDRVFLSGHSMGGDAAWDIGLAHPDQWAGVIPLVATADSNQYRYNALYWRNAKHVPFYFVGGELDGDKMAKNAYQFDRYLRHLGFDTLVVNFQGRGHENFSDEILNLFGWMKRQQRDFFPEEFQCETIRSWDNYFWWVEMNQMPAGLVADPHRWPPRRIRTLKVSGKILTSDEGTRVVVRSGKAPTTIWLSPRLVDFQRPLRVDCQGFRGVEGPAPDIGVILEDARTRGDRLHPFWARVDLPAD